MHGKITAIIFTMIAVTTLTAIPTLAAQGTWASAFQWDANGVSSVGTTNSYPDQGHFQLRVVRATGDIIGNETHVLKEHQSASATFWGQPFLDRQGQVLCSPQYWHSPWFDA